MVVVLSDKGDGRLEEFEVARKELGHPSYLLPEYQTGTLTNYMRSLVGYLDRVVRSTRPQVLLLPAPGTHQDHIAAYEAGMRAARLSYTDGSWFVPEVVLYDVPGYGTDLYATPYRWNRYVRLTDKVMDAKCDAIAAYSSQAQGHHDPVAMARTQAAMIGHSIGAQWGERYAVVREII